MKAKYCAKCNSPMLMSYSQDKDMILFRCDNCNRSYAIKAEDVINAETVMVQTIIGCGTENKER